MIVYHRAPVCSIYYKKSGGEKRSAATACSGNHDKPPRSPGAANLHLQNRTLPPPHLRFRATPNPRILGLAPSFRHNVRIIVPHFPTHYGLRTRNARALLR
jgi:hypothetical protein